MLAQLQDALADRYRLTQELGQGGMATVYLAHDLKHNRDLALKVLRPELAALVGVERFLREIQLTATLRHPHILTLLDSGESDGFLWYTLPYVQGESLRQKLQREKQVAVAEAVTIAHQVAGALEHAHRRGIIHRDVKPENILLHEGEAMLADFGIALAVRDTAGERLTETGLSLGTPEYMSPEQATADRALDGRSDIYSLGSVLYEMLAGEPPFTGRSAQAIIARLLTERPTSLRILRESVPPWLEAVVSQALAKVPADRFSSAAAFGEALAAAPPLQRPPRPNSRRTLLVGGAMVVALALGWGWFHTRTLAEQRLRRQMDLMGAAQPALSADSSQLPDSVIRAIRSAHAVPDSENIRYVFAPHGQWQNMLVLTQHSVIRVSPDGSRTRGVADLVGVGAAEFRNGTHAVYLQLTAFHPPSDPGPLSEPAAYVVFDTIYTGLNAREAQLLFDALNAVMPRRP